MTYNIFIHNDLKKENVVAIKLEQVKIAVNAYLSGEATFTVSGKTHYLSGVVEFKIFEINPDITKERLSQTLRLFTEHGKDNERWISPAGLESIGKEVTDYFLQNKGFGDLKTDRSGSEDYKSGNYIELARIKEIETLKHPDFDFIRLTTLCVELNVSYASKNIFATGMLLRGIMDHVPPIFGYEKFVQVASNYGIGGVSFKKQLNMLQNSFRNIADGFLHTTIRKHEILPKIVQIEFQAGLDALLAEIIRITKSKINDSD